jgi:hypothetical protein
LRPATLSPTAVGRLRPAPESQSGVRSAEAAGLSRNEGEATCSRVVEASAASTTLTGCRMAKQWLAVVFQPNVSETK